MILHRLTLSLIQLAVLVGIVLLKHTLVGIRASILALRHFAGSTPVRRLCRALRHLPPCPPVRGAGLFLSHNWHHQGKKHHYRSHAAILAQHNPPAQHQILGKVAFYPHFYLGKVAFLWYFFLGKVAFPHFIYA